MSLAARLIVTLAWSSTPLLHADDPVFSGPQPGERVTPFGVIQVAGSRSGGEFQLLTNDVDGAAPTVLIFVHEATRPGLQLMRPIDLYGMKLASEGVVTHFVWLTADRSKTEDWLRAARASLNLKSPVSISLDGIEGPGSFGLNRKVSLTIVIVKEHKTVANFAIVQPNETDAPKILEAMATLVGKTPPSLDQLRAELGRPTHRDMTRPTAPSRTSPERAVELSKLSDDPAVLIKQLEEKLAELDQPGNENATAQVRQILRLEAQIARLQERDQEHHARALARIAELEKTVGDLVEALNDSRATIAKLQGKPAPDPIKMPAKVDKSPPEQPKRQAADLPGRTPSDPELIALMRSMIQPTNDEETVKQISAAMLQWAGDSIDRKDDLRQFAKRIAHLGYGSEPAKKEINKLASAE